MKKIALVAAAGIALFCFDLAQAGSRPKGLDGDDHPGLSSSSKSHQHSAEQQTPFKNPKNLKEYEAQEAKFKDMINDLGKQHREIEKNSSLTHKQKEALLHQNEGKQESLRQLHDKSQPDMKTWFGWVKDQTKGTSSPTGSQSSPKGPVTASSQTPTVPPQQQSGWVQGPSSATPQSPIKNPQTSSQPMPIAPGMVQEPTHGKSTHIEVRSPIDIIKEAPGRFLDTIKNWWEPKREPGQSGIAGLKETLKAFIGGLMLMEKWRQKGPDRSKDDSSGNKP